MTDATEKKFSFEEFRTLAEKHGWKVKTIILYRAADKFVAEIPIELAEDSAHLEGAFARIQYGTESYEMAKKARQN